MTAPTIDDELDELDEEELDAPATAQPAVSPARELWAKLGTKGQMIATGFAAASAVLIVVLILAALGGGNSSKATVTKQPIVTSIPVETTTTVAPLDPLRHLPTINPLVLAFVDSTSIDGTGKGLGRYGLANRINEVMAARPGDFCRVFFGVNKDGNLDVTTPDAEATIAVANKRAPSALPNASWPIAVFPQATGCGDVYAARQAPTPAPAPAPAASPATTIAPPAG